MKKYDYEVKVVWTGQITAKNKTEAKEKVIKSFNDNENINLDEDEITIK